MRGRVYTPIKRVIDVAVSGSLLILLAPLLLAAAVAIYASMGRPILFRQARPGLNGEPFTLVKFRTMKAGDASDADRLTNTGRLLRSTSIDELPELWNVLKGDMSLIGPRPLFVKYLPLYSEHQAKRHSVRPGITGLAQVNGRNLLDWDKRLDMDVAYAENPSLVIDLRIAGQTVVQVAKRSGISAEGEATMPHFTGSTKPVVASLDTSGGAAR